MPTSLERKDCVITSSELKMLETQAQQQGEKLYQTTELGFQINLPRQFGAAGDRIIQLREGLTICIRSGQLCQPLAIEKQHEETFPIVGKFFLSGSSQVKTLKVPEIEPDYEEVAGYNYLYHLPNLTEFEQWQANSLIQVVMIYAHQDYFRSFGTTDNTLPRPLQILMQDSERFHQCLGKMTAKMAELLQQILYCPYNGFTQQLYLESKALELLALQFSCLESDSFASRQSFLKADDLDRVEYARDILVQHIDNPPSLIKLAHLAGLNERKLKQGFHQLYKTTVFGYLRDYRMEQACLLLERASITIAQVANKVGYLNPEAFSTAFRRKFGISPKAYQIRRRG